MAPVYAAARSTTLPPKNASGDSSRPLAAPNDKKLASLSAVFSFGTDMVSSRVPVAVHGNDRLVS